MFAGWGVGLTITELGGPSGADLPGAEGVVARPSRLSEVLPVEARSDAEIALELQRMVAIESHLAAYKAGLVMGLAANRPEAVQASAYAEGRSPVPGTGEFFVDELAVVCNASTRAAERSATESWVLIERLPAVWAALADGVLDWPRARVFIDVLGPTAEGVAEAVSERLLPGAVGVVAGPAAVGAGSGGADRRRSRGRAAPCGG